MSASQRQGGEIGASTAQRASTEMRNRRDIPIETDKGCAGSEHEDESTAKKKCMYARKFKFKNLCIYSAQRSVFF